MKKTNYLLSILIFAFMATVLGQAQTPDPNFHIYLAFGQSNMEGQNWSGSSIAYSDNIPIAYKQNVDPRFRVMAAVSGSYKLASGNEQRTKGNWYTAVPPLVRNNLGLCPADYFGRTLVAGIPDENIKIGVIVVAVAGAAINGFEKTGAPDYYKTQADYMKNTANIYGNDPYNYLLNLAKEAQKSGVIKGIIMHQGESGALNGNWGQKVKGIYDNMLNDLGLPANSIPILAGQAYGNNNGNISTLPSAITAKLPNGKNVAHVISSQGCASGGDNLHFSYEGYKKLGENYGQKMLELLYSEAETGFRLTTSVAPAAGGTITRNPDTSNGRYDDGANVSLTPVAAGGWEFESWSGDASGNQVPLSVKMDKDKTVTANFILVGDGTENLVRNGNFANTQLWTLNTGSSYGNSAGTYTPINNQAVINITAIGANPWEPQLIQSGIALEKGMKYRLTFNAYAAAPRQMEVLLQMAASPYTDYLNAGGSFDLTTESRKFSFEFEMTNESDINAQLAFNVGHSMQSVNISDMQLIYIAEFTDPGEFTGTAKISADPDTRMHVHVLPNSTVSVNFTAQDSGENELELYSLNGNLVASTKLHTFAGKNYSHTFNHGKLPEGLYIVWMRSNGSVEQAKVLIRE